MPNASEIGQASESTRLAIERTRLAYERTLMAWIRTSASLISFGFSIYKFFQYLHEAGTRAQPAQVLSTRHFALLMLVSGVVTLVIATLQHRQSMRALRAQYGRSVVPYSLAGLLAGFVGLLGLLGLASVIFAL